MQPQRVGELHVLHRTSHACLTSSWACKGLVGRGFTVPHPWHLGLLVKVSAVLRDKAFQNQVRGGGGGTMEVQLQVCEVPLLLLQSRHLHLPLPGVAPGPSHFSSLCHLHPSYTFKQGGSSIHHLHQPQISGTIGRWAFFQGKTRCLG